MKFSLEFCCKAFFVAAFFCLVSTFIFAPTGVYILLPIAGLVVFTLVAYFLGVLILIKEVFNEQK